MSGYVVAGYGVTAGTLVLYALHLLRRERVLSRTQAREREEQRWG